MTIGPLSSILVDPESGVVCIAATVKAQEALLPFDVLAVIVVLPALFAVTFPFETVAMDVLEDFHVTALSVALVGVTVAVSVSDSPILSDADVLDSSTFETDITGSETVSLQLAVLPFAVLAVIVVFPAFLAVIFPPDVTVATAVLEDVHVTVLFVVFDGAIVAISVNVVFVVMTPDVLFSVMEDALTVAALTVTLQVCFFLLAVCTVMTAVPGLIPLTTPFLLTVAIFVLEDVHASALFVAFFGVIVAVSVNVFPTTTDAEVLFSLTAVGLTFFLIVRAMRAYFFLYLIVMTALPAFLVTTTPFLDTGAIVLLLDAYFAAVLVTSVFPLYVAILILSPATTVSLVIGFFAVTVTFWVFVAAKAGTAADVILITISMANSMRFIVFVMAITPLSDGCGSVCVFCWKIGYMNGLF